MHSTTVVYRVHCVSLRRPSSPSFWQLLDRRHDGGEELKENARRDIGHDAEREDGRALQPTPYEEIVNPEDRALELSGERLQGHDVHTGSRDVGAEPNTGRGRAG